MSRLSDEIRRAFEPQSDLERLRLEAVRTLNRDEAKLYQKSVSEFEAQRRYVKRTYELEYAARVSKEKARLIDKAGSVKRDFAPRFLGTDGFNKDAINRQAQMAVRTAHRRDLAEIDQREAESIRSILKNSRAHKALREKPIKDFQNAVDRRSGVERRTRSWSR